MSPMCGRLALARAALWAATRRWNLALASGTDPWEPRYNVAPSQELLVVLSDGERLRLERRKWGLVPSWAKDPSIGHRMINARIESVAEKPAYRSAFRSRRCIVLASGFYEWKRAGTSKQPWHFKPPGDDVLGLAGIWESWKPAPDQDPILTCAIITRPSTGPVAEVHDRMPAALPFESWKDYLAPDRTDPRRLIEILHGPPPPMESFAVSKAVNNPRNDGPELVERA